MKFQPGVSGNPGGRPKGTPNKERRNFLDLQLWLKLVTEDLEKIRDPKERIGIELGVVDRILSKLQNLPASPQDSVNNAEARQAIMNALEVPPAPVENPGETNAPNT